MVKFHPSLVVAGAGVLLLSGAPAQAAEPPGRNDVLTTTAAPDTAGASAIELITGDTVLVVPGGQPVFVPGEGREDIGYTVVGLGGERYIVPEDASPFFADGTLDRRLFNADDLVAGGYAGAGALPVIVRDEPGAFDAMDATENLWTRVVHDRVDRVWLDGKATVTLDVSVPQVGAPQAWEAGYTGSGVTTAILDTGYDPAHPDLAGKVTAAEDFTGTSPDAMDGLGHGTHVASIVAGSGAASGGDYRGVAPDVDLLIGKICTDDGSCEDSDIIAGMEWAVANGADVVNLSLGGGPTDGTDPLSLAVNELTAASGTLFVIASGNDGCARCVSSPGTADAALTVGSVTKTDELSYFSNQGPRVGDYAVKPDIVAPGSDITAARAEGTEMGVPVGDSYVTASGTSMATPHVTGAVALLKQAHPDWDAEQLKAALMGSARGLGDLTVYEQGAGRLDAGAAVSTVVSTDTGSLSFGTFAYPYDGTPVTETVTYANDSDADVSLSLAVTGDAAMFTVDEDSLVVPAGGTASVTVTADPSLAGGTAATHGAVLTATDGIATVRTALGATLTPRTFDLTLDVTTRGGGPVTDMVVVCINVDTQEADVFPVVGADGTSTVKVLGGHYEIAGFIKEDGASTAFRTEVTTTDAGATVAWDAGDGELADVDLADRADERRIGVTDTLDAVAPSGAWYHIEYRLGPDTASYRVPSPATVTDFEYSRTVVYGSPDGAAAAYEYELYFPSPDAIPPGTVHIVHDAELAREEAVYHSQGVETTAYRYNGLRSFTSGVVRPAREIPLPSRRTEFYTAGLFWDSTFKIGGMEFDNLQWDTRGAVRETGTTTVEWNRAPLGAGSPAGARIDDQMLFMSSMYEDAAADIDSLSIFADGYTSVSTLSLNGEEISREDGAQLVADLPPGAAGTFVYTCAATRDVPWSKLGTASTAQWTFHSEPGAAGGFATLATGWVLLDSADVVNGFAPAGKRQHLTIDVQRPEDLGPANTKRLTLEVSYDDGKTWKKVPVHRNGDDAAATLRHPKGAQFVSTRLTAVDGDGNSVVQTMIRSYGLA